MAEPASARDARLTRRQAAAVLLAGAAAIALPAAARPRVDEAALRAAAEFAMSF